MKLIAISVPETSETPDKITVIMSTKEAAHIAKTYGEMTAITAEVHEIYSCLTGEFFNRFWDEGVDGVDAEEDQP